MFSNIKNSVRIFAQDHGPSDGSFYSFSRYRVGMQNVFARFVVYF